MIAGWVLCHTSSRSRPLSLTHHAPSTNSQCKDFCEYGADVCSGLDCGSLTSTSVSFDDKDCKGLGNSKCYGPLSPADESASTRTVAVAAITITLAAAAALF